MGRPKGSGGRSPEGFLGGLRGSPRGSLRRFGGSRGAPPTHQRGHRGGERGAHPKSGSGGVLGAKGRGRSGPADPQRRDPSKRGPLPAISRPPKPPGPSAGPSRVPQHRPTTLPGIAPKPPGVPPPPPPAPAAAPLPAGTGISASRDRGHDAHSDHVTGNAAQTRRCVTMATAELRAPNPPPFSFQIIILHPKACTIHPRSTFLTPSTPSKTLFLPPSRL